MNHLKRYTRQLSIALFLSTIIPGFITVAGYIVAREVADLNILWSLVAVIPLFVLASLSASMMVSDMSMAPTRKLWQAIWHISPHADGMPSPKLDDLKVGRELINSMVMQVYELASNGSSKEVAAASPLDGDAFLDHLPQPIIILKKDHTISAVNIHTCSYLNLKREEMVGRSLYDILRMSFQSLDTFDMWLQASEKSVATATKSWEHVRATLGDGTTLRQFDLAASFSKDNSSGLETVITIFDRSETYAREDMATSYVALAVHELRTPLPVLRGYIEVFDDEIGSQLSPELREFMRKMSAAAQSLTAFVSNILNVARVDENQLVLSLHEANWNNVLPEIVKDLELRASVRGKVIELNIEENLPTVAIDKISIYEVVSNLVDNAVKYGGVTPKVTIHARKGKDGTIETVVQDYGIGIPENSMNGLFTKFYRSHHSKNAISGSGLGLYLVKAIVNAHGGNVWANSKENEGSSFGFSLQTYETAMSQDGAKARDGIERQASGWIKNHSLYRR